MPLPRFLYPPAIKTDRTCLVPACRKNPLSPASAERFLYARGEGAGGGRSLPRPLSIIQSQKVTPIRIIVDGGGISHGSRCQRTPSASMP